MLIVATVCCREPFFSRMLTGQVKSLIPTLCSFIIYTWIHTRSRWCGCTGQLSAAERTGVLPVSQTITVFFFSRQETFAHKKDRVRREQNFPAYIVSVGVIAPPCLSNTVLFMYSARYIILPQQPPRIQVLYLNDTAEYGSIKSFK